MKDLYLPRETIIKGIAVLIVLIASWIKQLKGVDILNGMTQEEVLTIVGNIVGTVIIVYNVNRNFVTSKENDGGTRKSRLAKKLKRGGDLELYDELRGGLDDC